METKYIISDTLQSLIDWENIMKMPRCAGGHDEQMKGLFKGAKVIAHWNEGEYQGMVATCVKLHDGRFVIYNDYYGSCSGCDSWKDATDDEVKAMCINLSNGAFIFQSLNDVIEYLSNTVSYDWEECAKPLLERINAYCFKLSLYRMGFKDDIGNKDSMALLAYGFLIEISISNRNPIVTTISISQFDGQHRWLQYKQNVLTPKMANRVVDFDVIKYVMESIETLISYLLKEVTNGIESTLASNCREAIRNAMRIEQDGNIQNANKE